MFIIEAWVHRTSRTPYMIGHLAKVDGGWSASCDAKTLERAHRFETMEAAVAASKHYLDRLISFRTKIVAA